MTRCRSKIRTSRPASSAGPALAYSPVSIIAAGVVTSCALRAPPRSPWRTRRSRHRQMSPFTAVLQVRLCLPCQEHTGQRTSIINESAGAPAAGGWFGRKTKTRNTAMQPRALNLDELRMLPARYLRKHPELDDSLINGFGTITITAVEATGLVAADINLVGK